jgi:hypothetical protein
MGDTYNVFISWSGERSERVAAALYDWLPMVLQTARPWMSKEDIEKGSRGLEEIGRALETISVGIICLTPENVEKPWILFEAGALSRAMGEKTRVCPYLFGSLRPENVKLPLGIFQGTMALKDDTWKMVRTVNKALGSSLAEDKLNTLFERMWPELAKNLGEIADVAAAAPPQRAEREMLAELLELARAATSNDRQLSAELNALVDAMSSLHLLDVFRQTIGSDVLESWGGASRSAIRPKGTLKDMLGSLSDVAAALTARARDGGQKKEQSEEERKRTHLPSRKRAKEKKK